MLYIDKLSFFLFCQKLLNLGEFLVDSFVGCLLYLVTAIIVSIMVMVKIVKSNVSQLNTKIGYLNSSNTPYYLTLRVPVIIVTYTSQVNKVSFGAKTPMFERVNFFAYIE